MQAKLSLWRFKNLSRFSEIQHFVSARVGGASHSPYDSFNLGFHVGDDAEAVLNNREALALSLGVSCDDFVIGKQVHGRKVVVVSEDMRGRGARDFETAIDAADAFVTDVLGVVPMVLVADCVPVLLFDPKQKVVGVAHAGWKGTLKLIAKHMAEVLIEKFECSPADIVVGIGPSLGPCHTEVGPEALREIRHVFGGDDSIVKNHSFFDMWEANKKQLLDIGILEKNIEISGICTYCKSDRFFSARKSEGDTGRFGVGIFLRH
ncbi:hypothetical protein CL629_01810 [bacterium]|nr:hypothetical protein [bacterium]|tara:strand:- start:4491 stop:5279 length:789 start_codon:yes stop_codon:yes gene_type:complete